jgi:hypothetical protein
LLRIGLSRDTLYIRPGCGRARILERGMTSLDPVVYFFVLGFAAGLARADLRLPPAIYDFVSTILLLAIGLKGGVELARQPAAGLAGDVAIVIAMGVVLTLAAFGVLRLVGRLPRPDAAAVAAHYGSVSVATFAVGVAYLARVGLDYEPALSLFLVVLEVPAIIVGILLARGLAPGTPWGHVLREVFLGRGVLLLLGGLAIGWAAGPAGMQPISPLFVDLFKGILAIFLLEMGVIAASQLSGFLRYGAFLAAFALLIPPVFALAGALVGAWIGLSVGGGVLLATLAGSASYIAAPAAMRTAVPEANPAVSLTASLAFTFPFNILLGIPIYHRLVEWLYG